MVDNNRIIKLYRDGKSVRQIEKEVGTSKKTISKILRLSGIDPTKRKYGPFPTVVPDLIPWKTKEERNQLIEDLYQKGQSSIYISRALQISKKTVLRVLEKRGIDRRSVGLSKDQVDLLNQFYDAGSSIREAAEHVGVGEQVARKYIENKRDPGETMSLCLGQEDRINELYRQGMSTYDVASELNISTPDVITRFLKRHGLLRSESERKKLRAQKLANRDSFKSSLQRRVESQLIKMGIPFTSEYPFGEWNFDLKIGDVLVEIQGDYWHKLPNRRQRDQKKKELALNAGYQILYIWEHQIKNEAWLESYLSYQFCRNHVSFSFRDVEIQNASIDQVRPLVELWHYSGKLGNHRHAFRAQFNGRTIAVCVFGHVVRLESAKKQGLPSNAVLELSRLVIHPSYHKKNFATWFIAKCIRKIKQLKKYKLLISFADQTYNHEGVVYQAGNWTLDGMVRADYWYVQKRSILHKKTVWNRAKKAGLTESEYAKANNLQKVLGYQKYRYLYWLT